MPDDPRQPKATKATLRVLEAFLERPTEERHGFDLLTQTKVKSGTLYPLLLRLESIDWLSSRWEETDRTGPRRRLYRLTGVGEPAARQLVARARAASRPDPPGWLTWPAPEGGGRG